MRGRRHVKPRSGVNVAFGRRARGERVGSTFALGASAAARGAMADESADKAARANPPKADKLAGP